MIDQFKLIENVFNLFVDKRHLKYLQMMPRKNRAECAKLNKSHFMVFQIEIFFKMLKT